MSIESEQVVQLPGTSDPDEVVRRTVKALMAGAGLIPKTLSPHVRIPTSTLYERLKGTAQVFTGGEIWRIAEFFGVPVGDMFSGRYLPPDRVGSMTTKRHADWRADVIGLRRIPAPRLHVAALA